MHRAKYHATFTARREYRPARLEKNPKTTVTVSHLDRREDGKYFVPIFCLTKKTTEIVLLISSVEKTLSWEFILSTLFFTSENHDGRLYYWYFLLILK